MKKKEKLGYEPEKKGAQCPRVNLLCGTWNFGRGTSVPCGTGYPHQLVMAPLFAFLPSLIFWNLGMAWACHPTWGAYANLLPPRSGPLVLYFPFPHFFCSFSLFLVSFFSKSSRAGVASQEMLVL